MTITFMYDIEEFVSILPIDTKGIVLMCRLSKCGMEYLVCYWINGDRKESWLLEAELSKVKL